MKKTIQELHWWSYGKEFAFQYRGLGFDPWSEAKIPRAMVQLTRTSQLLSPPTQQRKPTTVKKKKIKYIQHIFTCKYRLDGASQIVQW